MVLQADLIIGTPQPEEVLNAFQRALQQDFEVRTETIITRFQRFDWLLPAVTLVLPESIVAEASLDFAALAASLSTAIQKLQNQETGDTRQQTFVLRFPFSNNVRIKFVVDQSTTDFTNILVQAFDLMSKSSLNAERNFLQDQVNIEPQRKFVYLVFCNETGCWKRGNLVERILSTKRFRDEL